MVTTEAIMGEGGYRRPDLWLFIYPGFRLARDADRVEAR